MPTPDENAAVHQPIRPDGRLRALYAASAAGLDIAGFLVQAAWLLCVFGLIMLVGSIVAAVVDTIV